MAAMTFSKLLATARVEPDGFTLDVGADWLQGRSVFGGLQVAIALRAMRALVPGVVLRTIQATFVAPVPAGPVRVHAKILRSGKSATHVEARLADGDTTLAIVIGVFGSPRVSAAAVTPVAPAVEPSPKPFELRYIEGKTAAFTQHFRVRWIQGRPPFTGDRGLRHVLMIDMHDADAARANEGHVVSIADFIPPVAMSHLTTPGPGSTLTWMMEFLRDRVDDLPLSGWRVDAELIAARDGYTSQSVMVWGPGGEPVVLSRQSMLVFS